MTDRRFAEIFASVARSGSLRRAAVELDLDPSAVSRAIRTAEAAHGVTLLDRTTKGVVLTDAGRVMYDHAMMQLDEARRLQTRLRRLSGQMGQSVRIGCGAGFLNDLMENGLPRIKAAEDPVDIVVETGSTAEIVENVVSGAADLGIAYDIPALPQIRTVVAAPHPLRIVAPPRNAGRIEIGDMVDLAQISAIDMALMPGTHGVRQLLDRSAERRGIRLRPVVTCNSVSGLLHFVRCGHGITFLPENTAAALADQGAVRLATLRNPSLNAPAAALFVRSRRRLLPAVEHVLRALSGGMRCFQAEGRSGAGVL